ncbi:hypothetical protein C8Q79DRAFT_905316 [Trametes meyenii]|nr:hypothetical protein C8Q79DRAFT_905316 [Trametes meyenii]
MPATPTHANTTESSGIRSSPASLSTLTTIDNVQATHAVITTTITSGGVGSLPTAAAVSQSRTSDVPVAAIAGGTAAGVVLAFVAVISWAWWGRCIKRKKAKEVKEALAVLQVRENTRKNASSSSHPITQYRPTFFSRAQHERRVKFMPTALSPTPSTVKGTVDSKTVLTVSFLREEKTTSPPAVSPRPPTPSSTLQPPTIEPPLPPPIPRRNPSRTRAPIDSTVSNAPSSFAQHRLVHQPSTLSTGSVYSTQSAIEERQTSAVPSSLLQALTNEDMRKSLLANYLPWNRHRTSTVSQNRLSEYSTGSFYSQFNEQPWESVGYAYGDEEELMRRSRYDA